MSLKMMKKKLHSSEFKSKVAIAAIKGDKTIAELCQEFWKYFLKDRQESLVLSQISKIFSKII